MRTARIDREENLLGYLLNALDTETHRAVEDHLRHHPEAQVRLDRLRLVLEPLAQDRGESGPPPGLAQRTLARIADGQVLQLPRAPKSPRRTNGTERRSWRRRDVVAAASLILLALGVGLPWLVHVRAVRASRVECQNNLRAFHQALTVYSQSHEGNFPKVEEQPPRNVAGVFVPLLHEAGTLGPDISVTCPASGRNPLSACPPSDPSSESVVIPLAQLVGYYAYSLGYRDEAGRLHGLRRDPSMINNDLLPVLSDSPLVQGDKSGLSRVISPFHKGGQNVLHVGGHVHYCTNSAAGVAGDDIFFNQLRQVAAGLNPWDTVLGTCADRP